MFGFVDKLYGRSSQWRSVRKRHIEKNPTCAACGRDDDLDVHHIIPYHIAPEKELDLDNLITLCGKRCHLRIGHLGDWKSRNVDVVEDCASYRMKCLNRPYQIRFAHVPQKETGFYNAILNIIIGYFTYPFIDNHKRRNNKS